MSKALILSGGAPNMTLMAGALYFLEEKGVKFDVISSAGAGAVVGLVYVAPKEMNCLDALKGLVDLGVHDSIYKRFPVNYKVFEKPGYLADFYRNLLQSMPLVGKDFLNFLPRIGDVRDENDVHKSWRFFIDWIKFFSSAFCPSSLTPGSTGLCAHAPFISKVVDFSRIRDIESEFYISAYNITEQRMENFSKDMIDVGHFHASLSFPFIYPPYEMNGNYYIEGAAENCLNYEPLINKHPEIDTIVVFDIMGIEDWVREPRDLYDAWVMSIIIPLVAISKAETRIFELKHNKGEDGRPVRKLLKVPFEVPAQHLPDVMHWSYSNLERLFEIGYESGLKFYETHEHDLAG
ncbi:MAG: patatin-like phospholipase family protein [Desulfobacterales bacterium]|nr:patatin-like phospholipase family protein [Desulfobacterales bacterium]